VIAAAADTTGQFWVAVIAVAITIVGGAVTVSWKLGGTNQKVSNLTDGLTSFKADVKDDIGEIKDDVKDLRQNMSLPRSAPRTDRPRRKVP
jgi:hypothetical protein